MSGSAAGSKDPWWTVAVIAVAMLCAVITPVAVAVQPGTTAPDSPLAPPVADEGDLGANRCAPPTTTVVDDVPWAQQRLIPDRVWPLSTGAGQVVAVIDSGVDATVPQLAGRVLRGLDVVDGRSPGTADCVGHGTFVAGVIAAGRVPGVGFAGMAPDARILPVRQTTDGENGTAAGMSAAIRYATDNGARVINISAATAYSTPELESTVAQAIQRGVVIVAAASNEAENGNPKAYPAAYPGVIAVGAIDVSGARAEFSETGSFISVAAPGVDVLSVGPRGPGHLVGNGTSYAAPFVSGVAALVRAYHPALTPAQVKHRIEATADHPAAALPDRQLGWGVINPYAAVATVLPEESAAAPVSVTAVVVPPVDLSPRRDPRLVPALVFGTSSLGLIALAAVLIAVVRGGRRRGWRPVSPRRADNQVREVAEVRR